MKTALFDPRLWINPTPGDIRRWVDDISKEFTGAGWKNLPQELVDRILGYLLDDLAALRACSLTCKRLFGAARPFIHRRFVYLGSKPGSPQPKRSLFGRRGRDPAGLERLIDADRSGVLGYTQHLTLNLTGISSSSCFNPKHMQKCLPYLRSITKLHTLTLSTFPLRLFIPVFNDHFGIFTNTLRHLDIRNACITEQQLSYIICQFPLLEDLTIVSPAETVAGRGLHVPTITQSPPLRGTLVLAQIRSTGLYEGLAAFPGGLNFRSMELFNCEDPRTVFAACGHTVMWMSYLWLWGAIYTTPLDLKSCVVLERFEFTLDLSSLGQIDRWIHQTLRTITSTLFNEFAIWILNTVYPWSLQWPSSDNGWNAVDELLNVLAERNPDFRVMIRGDFYSFRYGIRGEHDTIRWLIEDRLPLISSKGLVKFEQVVDAENRFRKSGVRNP